MKFMRGFSVSWNLKHPGLSKTEKRLCSLMVLNLETKEIATLLNITLFGAKKGPLSSQKEAGIKF